MIDEQSLVREPSNGLSYSTQSVFSDSQYYIEKEGVARQDGTREAAIGSTYLVTVQPKLL